MLIFLIDKRGRELQSHRNDFSVTFSHESSRSALIGFRIRINRIGQPIVVIVRHAEKAANGGNDPDLSSASHARANELARILKDSGITAIFTTEFKRTQETAAPTTKSTHVTPAVVAAKETAALVTKLHQLNGNALVVGMATQFRTLSKRLESIARSTFLTRITRSC